MPPKLPTQSQPVPDAGGLPNFRRPALLLVFGACLALSIGGAVWLSTYHRPSLSALPVAGAWLLAAALAWPLLTRQRVGVWATACLACVLLGRLASFLVTDGSLPQIGDPANYLQIATNLAAGEGLVWKSEFLGEWRAFYPPLYPTLLGSCLWISGGAASTPLFLNSVIDAGASLLIFLLGKRLGAARAGAAAAYLYLIWPPLLLAAYHPQKESLAALLVVGQLCTFVPVWRSGIARWRDGVALGLLTGLLALNQPAFAPIAAFLILFTVQAAAPREILRLAAAAAFSAALVLLPWWMRNWIMLDGFVPLTTSGTINLYNYAVPGGLAHVPSEAAHLSEAERAKLFGQIAVEWILAHPLEFFAIKAKQAALTLGLEHQGVGWLLELPSPRVRPASFAPLAQLSLVTLWLAGLLSAARSKGGSLADRMLGSALLACFLHIFLINNWFEFAQRHRIFLLPPILLWAAIAARQAASTHRS